MENKLKINFHITEACNFSCKFCFARYSKKQLTFEQQKAVIKIIAESGLFNAINFAGASTREVDALFFSNLRFLGAY